VSFVLSILGSNAFPERIFSLINSKLRRDRNRMSIPLVKAELQVLIIYLDCRAPYSLVIEDQALLNAAAERLTIRLENWKKRSDQRL